MEAQNYNEKQNSDQPQVAVVMVPLPAQGHLNQLLHLSHLIASYGVPVHFVGSSAHNRQAKSRLHGWAHHHNHQENHHENTKTNPSEIHFHDVQLPAPNNNNPSSYSNTYDETIILATHFQSLFDASSSNLFEPTHNLLQQLSKKFRRVVVIHDMLMAYVVQDVKLIPNAESYVFIPIPAFTIFVDSWRFIPDNLKPFNLHPNDIPQSYSTDLYQDCMIPEMLKYITNQFQLLGFESGWLYNTSRALEQRYVQLMEKLKGNIKHFAVGPLHPVAAEEEAAAKRNHRHECIEWLDKQEKGSVIYVSFGSTTILTDDQITELANGLDECGCKFLWVLRKADFGEVFAEEDNGEIKEKVHPQLLLPQGFEQRIKNKGIVVRDWAPQVEILAHKSVGGFMSHCGWNSCIESLSMGVPMAVWAMHSDQPRNAVMVSQVLGVGVVVRDWGRRSEVVVTADSIATAVRRLMVSNEGKEMKERAVKLGEVIRGSVFEGGVSSLERDAFISHITRY